MSVPPIGGDRVRIAWRRDLWLWIPVTAIAWSILGNLLFIQLAFLTGAVRVEPDLATQTILHQLDYGWPVAGAVGGLVLGAILGVVQWGVLKNKLPGASRWIWANSVGMALAIATVRSLVLLVLAVSQFPLANLAATIDPLDWSQNLRLALGLVIYSTVTGATVRHLGQTQPPSGFRFPRFQLSLGDSQWWLQWTATTTVVIVVGFFLVGFVLDISRALFPGSWGKSLGVLLFWLLFAFYWGLAQGGLLKQHWGDSPAETRRDRRWLGAWLGVTVLAGLCTGLSHWIWLDTFPGTYLVWANVDFSLLLFAPWAGLWQTWRLWPYSRWAWVWLPLHGLGAGAIGWAEWQWRVVSLDTTLQYSIADIQLWTWIPWLVKLLFCGTLGLVLLGLLPAPRPTEASDSIGETGCDRDSP